ncbi:hypothetical protein jhhlp_007410 [Lomentospora prolificans]|uniref:RNA helicase n=1 Tax=Lomentospora prolificans TaxID=41688 RepID=A0A2N3N2K9_9PEZI|nr:hypothetical protein jhhlp_007410 [Lomentospora prolificans]
MDGVPKLRFIPKREREKMDKEKKEREEQVRLEKERKRAEERERQRRKREEEEKVSEDIAERFRRPVKKPGQKLTADDIDQLNFVTRYLGPEINKNSTFAPRKRRRGAKEFNFDWDPLDDTSRPEDGEETREGGHRRKDKGGDTQWPLGWGADAEAKALKQAKILEEMHGRERAEEHMRKFYEDRERRKAEDDRLLGRTKNWVQKSREEMTDRDWRLFKDKAGITMKGASLPNPMRNWQESGLPMTILDTLRRRNFQDPTPIQQAAIPIALSSRDIIGVAKTGSGKTLAFVLPLLVYISQLPPLTEYNMSDGPYALILAPTRELAQQIEKEAKAFADPLGFSVVCIVGGHSLEQQALALQAGAHIIVGTPGRLVDCIENQFVVFHRCSYLVMDEADRMIDMGFEEPVNRILSALPSTERTADPEDGVNLPGWNMPPAVRGGARQTMMFTATMSPRVEKIAAKYMRQPAVVTIGSSDEAVDTVEQRVEFIAGEAKRLNRLGDILSDPSLKSPVIVFVNVKHNCDAVAKAIRRMGWNTATLHSGKTQQQREAALKDAREGRTDVLVATDLAGRGIDVPDVSLVINFNMANTIESYTHRIGRTGRAGKSGVAITFLGPEDNEVLYELRQMISKSPVSRVPEDLARHEAAQQRSSRRR